MLLLLAKDWCEVMVLTATVEWVLKGYYRIGNKNMVKWDVQKIIRSSLMNYCRIKWNTSWNYECILILYFTSKILKLLNIPGGLLCHFESFILNQTRCDSNCLKVSQNDSKWGGILDWHQLCCVLSQQMKKIFMCFHWLIKQYPMI